MNKLDKIISGILSILKAALIIILILAGFIGLGRFISNIENKFTGVSENRSYILGLRIFSVWIVVLILPFILYFTTSDRSWQERYVEFCAYIFVCGIFGSFFGLFGYGLKDKED
jgi:hypothetical protein